ncbi:MAG TPA: DUF2752 domain-containing protein [Bacteroidales bacterium]|nr:DUF2752 domain-containing protein [Bacteroidales bacterium]HQL70802.1 DUF2752 domain-containing protein [Bacteroidales bacterium]
MLRHNLIPCPFKAVTGCDCPGCGMQRSIVELLDGNFLQSLHYYPALLPLILLFVILVFHLRFQFRYGTLILKILFIFNTGLISLNFILKLLNIHWL